MLIIHRWQAESDRRIKSGQKVEMATRRIISWIAVKHEYVKFI